MKLETVSKAVAYTEKELKKAATLEIELPALKHFKVVGTEAIQEQVQTALNEVLENALAQIEGAISAAVDAKNGEGYTAILMSMPKVQCSLFSAKNQNKAHKLLAIANGDLSPEVMEADAVVSAGDTPTEELEVAISI